MSGVSEKHMDRARQIVWSVANEDMDADQVATALANAQREGFREGMKRAAEIAKREGVYPELNIFGGGPEWYQHGQRIASAILTESGEA